MSESWLRKKFDSCAPGRVVGREVGGVLETSEHGASIETIRVCHFCVRVCGGDTFGEYGRVCGRRRGGGVWQPVVVSSADRMVFESV